MDDTGNRDSLLDINIGLLIKLVKNFPYIYDHNHKSFKDLDLRDQTWNTIASTLKVTVNDCLRIWRNIRDKYSRERRIMNDNSTKKSKWEFFDAMDFLHPFVKRRRRTKGGTRRFPRTIQLETDKKDESVDTDKPTLPVFGCRKLWSKDSPEYTMLNDTFNEDDLCEAEEITLEAVIDSPEQPTAEENPATKHLNIKRHQTSEEAFGAYIASRLMDFPQEVRIVKKAKIFKALEDIDSF